MEVLIVASGDLAPSDEAHLGDAALVIAADGGATRLERLGSTPALVVGDLDSADPALVERLAAGETRIERHPTDKEASDTALAVRAALAAGATRLVLLGTTGGDRLDHSIANLLLLTDPALSGVDVRVVHGPDTVRHLAGAGALRLEGEPGDLVSLLPLGGDARGLTTDGLRWPLENADLPLGGTRGLSNEIVATPASVAIQSGTLLVIEHSQKHHRELTA